MNVLITGCCGFIGSYLFNEIDSNGIDDLSFGNCDAVNRAFLLHKIGIVPGKLINQYDVLVHLATASIVYSIDNPLQTFQTNAIDTIELFKKFKGKIIYTSSASVYGNANELPAPETAEIKLSNAYDMSKHIAEQYLMQRGNYTTLRLSNVYGKTIEGRKFPNVIDRFKQSVKNNETIVIYGDGSQTRDFTYIADVIEAIKLAIELPAFNTEINISGSEELSILEIAKIINNDKKVFFGSRRENDKIGRRYLDCTKAELLLGWKPKIKFKDGINKF